jgi:hypothetical protein
MDRTERQRGLLVEHSAAQKELNSALNAAGVAGEHEGGRRVQVRVVCHFWLVQQC